MGFYSKENVDKLNRDYSVLYPKYAKYVLNLSDFGESLTENKAREHLYHGVLRRISLIKYAISKIYTVFPVIRETVLTDDERDDVTVCLQSVFINTAGLLDNLAWIYVYEKGGQYKNYSDVGFFKFIANNRFPEAFCEYISNGDIKTWHSIYAKKYRDTLAHQVPFYIPPYMGTGHEKRAVPVFRDSIIDNDKLVAFHVQIIADFNTIVEISEKYLHLVWGRDVGL